MARFLIWLWLLPVAATMLASCGFRPLYGSRSGADEVADLLPQVQISIIEARDGQILRNHLIDRFYLDKPSKTPLYRLDVFLSSSVSDLSVRADDETTRRQFNLTARYTLFDVRAAKEVLATENRLRGAFNVPRQSYAAFATERDAVNQALEELSELITLRVASFLRQEP